MMKSLVMAGCNGFRMNKHAYADLLQIEKPHEWSECKNKKQHISCTISDIYTDNNTMKCSLPLRLCKISTLKIICLKEKKNSLVSSNISVVVPEGL